jgi:hypothetical protein
VSECPQPDRGQPRDGAAIFRLRLHGPGYECDRSSGPHGESMEAGATLWLLWMIAMWAASFVLLLTDKLAGLWSAIRDLLLLVEGRALVALPSLDAGNGGVDELLVELAAPAPRPLLRARLDARVDSATQAGGKRPRRRRERRVPQLKVRRSDHSGIDVYWLPLGAGGHSVRVNGLIFDAIAARLQHSNRSDLYHAASRCMSGEAGS